MKTTGLILGIFILIASYAYADLIVYPKDVKDWPQYSKNDLLLIQESVDEGHQPWLASAEDYAVTFVETYYGLSGDNSEHVPDGKIIKEGDRFALVEFDFRGKRHLVELGAPIKPNSQEGIWVVEKMTILGRGIQ